MTTTPTTTASGTATENAIVPSATVPSATVPSATVPSEAATTEATADAVAERLFTSVLGGLEVLSVYLGDRLGWYRSLREEGPATPSELAGRTATVPRYAREWLEQQAVIGLLQVDTTGPERRYTLPDGAAEVLTDEDSLSYLAPLSRFFGAVGRQLDGLLEAYRHGGGVSWEELGADAREAQADANRPWFLSALPDALRSAPELHARLSRPGARILDVGCGAGWSTIALARAYPDAEVVGIDVDAPSIEMAWRNAAGHRTGGRPQFRVADVAALSGEDGSYDAAFAFECIHDLSQPVEVLAAVRRAVHPGGPTVVVDEAVDEEFTAPGNDVERLMYGYSLFVCLPDGLSSSPSAGTGTVMRPATLRGYAQQAGFDHFEVLPIDGFAFFRFYQLS
jgi:SAM-dependent methyltransferase